MSQRVARRAAGCVALSMVIVALWATGCDNPVAAFVGVTGTSSEQNGHRHQATVPPGDIDDPPSDGRTYSSTTAGTPAHSHAVRLNAPQLADLKQSGAGVEVTSAAALAGTAQEHTHTFLFER